MNDNKTCVGKISSGFQFLGYAFNSEGKTIPEKARDNLTEKLEAIWYSSNNRTVEDKLAKCAEIIEGWNQYFRGERVVSNIYEYVAILYMTWNKRIEIPQSIMEQRRKIQNADKHLCRWITAKWKEKSCYTQEMMEYEDYYQLSGMDLDIIAEGPFISELLERYRQLVIAENVDLYTDIMQIYTDMGCYNKAAAIMDKINCLQNSENERNRPVIQNNSGVYQSIVGIKLTKEQVNRYFEIFVGREDTYAREEIDKNGRRRCQQIMAPLDDEVIKQHLSGEQTVGTYVQRSNATAKYLVIDIDVSKKVILETADSPEAVRPYLQKAAELTQKLNKELDRMGFNAYIEESGFRGYHIWLLFTEWIPVRYIFLLEEILEKKVEADPELSVEFFPNRTRVSADKPGQSIKLPLGFHVKSGKQSFFLTKSFEPVSELGTYICEMIQFSLLAVKRVIGAFQESFAPVQMISRNVDEDLSAFSGATDNVLLVLQKCNLMRYLCQKAKNTGYLTHFERLSLLYVFGHLGEEGEDFLHMVMRFTLNYQYHVTQKFIARRPAKPISCLKLRDQYQKITAEYGCSCNFNRIKNCYPSPVLHAIKSGKDEQCDITLPTSRTLSKEKEAKVCEELNLNKRVYDITTKILEFKKQKRGIDKNICKLEKELEKLFDDARIDCLEVEYGMLVRRKTDTGYEWIVEI